MLLWSSSLLKENLATINYKKFVLTETLVEAVNFKIKIPGPSMRYDGLRSSMANGPGSLCCFGSWKPSVSRPLPEIIGLGSDCCRVSFSSRIWWYGLASWNKARGNRHKEVINDVRLFLEWILGHALQWRFDISDNNRKLLRWSAGIRPLVLYLHEIFFGDHEHRCSKQVDFAVVWTG